MTDEKKINKLLDAFYSGNTIPEEEYLLSKFFNSEDIDEKWYIEKDIFNVLHDSSDIQLPEGFSERLENAIDKYMAETIPQKSRSKTIKILIKITSAAAVILIGTGLFFITDKPAKSYIAADTYTEPKEATMVAEQALILVSTKLNQGFYPLKKVKESVDKTNELLSENLKLN
ncbi:MAG: hypothetical protein LBG96_15130 [Tannerella sp.]|jgi:hypothetical protein|nr:hypothetical protein [Tannerella sp.]